jgi:hypothetical protein
MKKAAFVNRQQLKNPGAWRHIRVTQESGSSWQAQSDLDTVSAILPLGGKEKHGTASHRNLMV